MYKYLFKSLLSLFLSTYPEVGLFNYMVILCLIFWASTIFFSPAAASFYIPTAAAKSLQSCPTLCDPRDGSPPGSAVPGILRARTLEWVAISFSSAWKWKKWSRSVVSNPQRPHGRQPQTQMENLKSWTSWQCTQVSHKKLTPKTLL